MFLLLSAGLCEVPGHFHGDFYSIDQGIEIQTIINKDGITNGDLNNALCTEFRPDNSSYDATGRFDAHVLFHDVYVILVSFFAYNVKIPVPVVA